MDQARHTIGAFAHGQRITGFELSDAKVNCFPRFFRGAVIVIIAAGCDKIRVAALVTVSRLCWGIFCVVAALAFNWSAEATRQTTIVLINAVGSMLYGPILAAFLLGMLTRRFTGPAVTVGIAVGIVSNLILWLLTDISWLWWNFNGFMITTAVSFAATSVIGRRAPDPGTSLVRCGTEGMQFRGWLLVYALLICYFFLLMAICHLLQNAL